MRTKWFQVALVLFIASGFLAGFFDPTIKLQAQPLEPPITKQLSIVPEGDQISIYVSNFDGSERKLVVSVDMLYNHPLFTDFVSLSPDGSHVVYVTSDNTALLNAEVWIAPTDGSGTARIALFSEGFWTAAPIWSPDGTQLAYVLKRPDSLPDEGLQLWVMNSDGSNQKLITEDGDLRPVLFERIPQGVVRWCEDGTCIEFQDRWSSPPYLYRVDLTTGAITRTETDKDPEAAQQLISQALPCAVPVFNQNNYSNVMQTCGYTIAQAGCALTSSAMLLKYYGVNTDPPTLNTCLGNAACPLYWGSVASSCSEGKVSLVGARHLFSYAAIDQDLAAGKPVIVWVKTSSGGTHFVVVTGGSGQTPGGYTINDPSGGSTNKTLANYTNAGWTLAEINRYSGTPSCPSTDPDGGAISYGQTKNGTISPARDFDDFYFTASAGDIVEIRQNKNGSSLDSFVELSGPGNYYAYNDDGGGSYNSFLRRTLPSSGQYRIRAKGYGTSTGAYTLNLTKVVSCGGDCEGDPRWIAFGQTLNGTTNPNNDQDTYYFSGTSGRAISVRMNKTGGALDPYLELYSPSGTKLKWNDDGGGSTNAWLVHTLPSNGTYRIVARSYNNGSSGTYSIKLESITGGGGAGNLARGKAVAVSSVEFSGVEGWRATDGSTSTRWSSQFSNLQWIYIDLGQNRTFNQVVLKWEAAYGKNFGIYYWTGSQWHNVYWTNNGRGGTNTINFSPVTARFVMMYGTQRGTSWGYSLWEFEVYDTSTTVMPDVPPDDPGKVDEGSIAPLPPTEGDKEVMLSGEGDYGQEEMPLAEPGDAASVTEQMTVTQSVVAFISSPSELDGLYTPAGYILFDGTASSQVGDSEIAITAYSWRSDRSGVLGAQQTFTVPVTSLPPGSHTIYFKAQNELGTWSEEVTTTLTVQWPYTVYLPLTVKLK